MTAVKKIRKPYWVKRYIGECPPCGRDMGYSERIYGVPKPADLGDRQVHLSDQACYCGCVDRT